ncbi:ABC transporter ATP-binding protein [Cardinium endosymbiont of Culicoides punctatus]|uniref:ABC transporter ATP-binding protein n=1 Tax=Cardinium endosymbiont of Culicoides punctatus TaxID=2304601 RepID=UPI0010588E38|nr:ABC transporter ATP-binding protein [Cardinium endosymbiont of Culicoides punctatus]TDG95264.1 putative ABC transporter ATP-binding protein YknY [Cardinium endosymbiont of Culicoides punctatus]
MIQIQNLYKSYQTNGITRKVLDGINFQLEKGDLVALMGQSGAGKSTLLNILGILDDYDAGDYYLNGVHIKNLSIQQASQYRSQLVGFIFQRFHLIPFKTALENVALPLYYQGIENTERRRRAWSILDRVGLADHAHHKPNALSGGQQQRVAIARALVTAPPLILADEPTGALDSSTSYEIMALLKEMNREGNTILIVTHSSQIARQCNSIQEIVDGKIVQ